MPNVFDSSEHKQKGRMQKNKSQKSESSHKDSAPIRRDVNEYSDVLASEPQCDRVFTSFAPKPKNTRFESQAPGETVVLLLRKHPVTQLTWIVGSLVLAFVPGYFSFFPLYEFLPFSFRLGITFMWYLVLFGYSFQSFLKWFYSVYILTDERVIDVDFVGLAQKNITAAKIENIEDITSETIGFSSTFFDHGNVLIQTAGAEQEITFESVPKPAKVTALLNDLLLEEEREKLEGRVN